MTRVIDFDAFRAEQKVEPIALKLGGHTYSLPAALPATLALDVIRKNSVDAAEELDPATMVDMGEAIFGGPEQFNKILTENNVTMNELPELFKMVFATYNGEPEAPNPESPSAPTPAKKGSSR